MRFCRFCFSAIVSFRYVLVFLNCFVFVLWVTYYFPKFNANFSLSEDIFLCKLNLCYWWQTYAIKFRYWSKSTSRKYFMFYEMPLKLYFMKCSERKISQCILPFIKESLTRRRSIDLLCQSIDWFLCGFSTVH